MKCIICDKEFKETSRHKKYLKKGLKRFRVTCSKKCATAYYRKGGWWKQKKCEENEDES